MSKKSKILSKKKFKQVMLYVIIFCILIVIIFFVINRFMIIPNVKYDNVIHIQQFLNKQDISRFEQCNSMDNEQHLQCLQKETVHIKKKLKQLKQTDFIDIGHIRWSMKTKNYDGRSYHRDVKPLFSTHMTTLPQVYTLAIFLDKAYHYQGGTLYTLEPGDAVLFNAFNLHKGYTKQFIRNTPRRVIQVFNIVFSKKDKQEFYKHHAYSINPYITGKGAILLKHINKIFDLRTELEYYNMSSLLLQYTQTDKTIKYVTAVDEKGYTGTFDSIKYYNKF